MSDEELFDVMQVKVTPRTEDMPGRPLRRTRCNGCGEYVQDMREIFERKAARAQGRYYTTEKAPRGPSREKKIQGNCQVSHFASAQGAKCYYTTEPKL